MADKTKVYEDPERANRTGATPPGKTKIYEQKNRNIAAWLIPLLLIIAALIIWAATRDHHQNAPTQAAAVETLPNLHFDTDQAALTPESQTTLNHAANLMNNNPNLKMRIEGFTDSTGNAAHNQTLSDRRTAAVAQFMTSKGISNSRLTGQGFGQTDPANTNATASGQADNRRVQIQLFQ